ncbi:putative spermidine/putrescine transport system ATP-binding protein [Saccharothrix tamanrassetensis]|uniref:ABC-type quaternary amine transporter n=1 Tax=Saccharothrix tamanrassetensis TaxID=1051531 RepID=A0A841CE42_9PSEU|nr:ABC transporter ATP-binding protein [Saccharothrix tamanrassetensis]MBB5954295.1 putative spermidine/putrescine transport system ATP-binding protein [Saccharothrix tamanrassetensis]
MGYLELHGLRKSFGGQPALAGLDLELARGELVSLLGPSGCGKTTALRIVAGFETADSGTVRVDGRDITGVPANRRDMGMVFQAYSLFPNMTAAQNIAFGLRLRKAPDRAKRTGELLELVGLEHLAKRYPHQLSGGQQQRVALARALAIQPRVLLLDEPLSALDAKVRVSLRDEIRRIQTGLGMTTLFVTHDQEEALAVSDRVGVMSQGRLEQLDTPAVVYRQPASAFVAQFVGVTNAVFGTAEAGGVRLGTFRLATDAAEGLAAGTDVKVIVRPEDIGIAQHSGQDNGALVGSVLTQSFLGSVTRLSVRLDGGEQVVRVDQPSSRAGDFPPGTTVALDLAPTRLMVVEA